jgi:hypothetical protein
VRPGTMKLMDIGLDKEFLNMIPEAQAAKLKIDS